MVFILLTGLLVLAIAVAVGPHSIADELRGWLGRWLRAVDSARSIPEEPAARSAASHRCDELDGISQSLKDVAEQIETFRGVAEERGREIQRLREGHDFTATRSFARGVIKAIDLAQDFRTQLSESHPDDASPILRDALRRLEALESHLTLLLEANQIECFTPEPGDYIANDSLRYRPVEKHPASSPSDVGKVIDVKHPGYVLLVGDADEKVIREAQVGVFCSVQDGSSSK